MKSKGYIQEKLDSILNTIQLLHKDLNNNKPHADRAYIMQQLNTMYNQLQDAINRLDLE